MTSPRSAAALVALVSWDREQEMKFAALPGFEHIDRAIIPTRFFGERFFILSTETRCSIGAFFTMAAKRALLTSRS